VELDKGRGSGSAEEAGGGRGSQQELAPAEVGGVRKLGWMNGVEEYHAEHTSFQECLIITADVM